MLKKRRTRHIDVAHDLPGVDEESREEPDLRLSGVYVVLGAIVLASVLATIFMPETPWVDRYGAEMATEAFGILLTLVFVQRFLQRQERARRLRGSIGALRKGNRALTSLAWTWAELVRGSLRRPPVSRPTTLAELFAPHYAEDLTHWDPRLERESDGVSEPSGRWATRRIAEAQEALNDIIVTYGGALDPGYVEAVDELVDDPFLRLIRDVGATAPDPRELRPRLNTARALRDAHFHRLLRAIAIHNQLAAEAGQLRSRRTAPRTGSVGLKLPLDHDLRVPMDIGPRWWQS